MAEPTDASVADAVAALRARVGGDSARRERLEAVVRALASDLRRSAGTSPFDRLADDLAEALPERVAALGAAVEDLRSCVAAGPSPGRGSLVDRMPPAGARLRAMVRDLEDYAAAGSTPRLEPVDVAASAREVRRRLAAPGGPGAPRVDVTGPAVPADRARLGQLLRHLLTNAARFAPGSGVIVSTANSDGGWDLRVADHGPGVPLGDRARILQPFVRLPRDRHLAGWGLGLATCQRVAATHGADLVVAETAGGGTTVILSGAAQHESGSCARRSGACGRRALTG